MKHLLVIIVCCFGASVSSQTADTCDRIKQHGYFCETHTIQTHDNYILTMFRIPQTRKTHNASNASESCVVLMMHGLFGSSDTAVLNGPASGLPFMLSDSGCDVWLGNSRGKRYSREHVFKSSWLPSYWDFSWHEIGIYDLPAKVDFILAVTGQDSIHYIGHSQGGTTLMVLLTMRPEYNQKIKSAHLLAPAVFMSHSGPAMFQLMEDFLGVPSALAATLSSVKLGMPSVCRWPLLQKLCIILTEIAVIAWSPNTNMTLLPLFYETHPDDCSLRQVLHFMQVRKKDEFSCFDYGSDDRNLEKYGYTVPPVYALENINTTNPIHIYFSDKDDWVAAQDVRRLLRILGQRAVGHHIPYPDWNHWDFVFAQNVREAHNECIVELVTTGEGTVKC